LLLDYLLLLPPLLLLLSQGAIQKRFARDVHQDAESAVA